MAETRQAGLTRREALGVSTATLSGGRAYEAKRHQAAETLSTCRRSFEQLVRAEDELYDYFRLSLVILKRLDQLIRKTGGGSFDRDYGAVLAAEASALGSFFLEEAHLNEDRRRRRSVVFRAERYGLKGDGKSDNRPAFMALLEQVRERGRPATILLPEGSYYFSAAPAEEGRLAAGLEFRGLRGLSVIGEGAVRVLIDGNLTPHSLLIEQCHDLQIRNLTLDMVPLPFTAGVVLAAYPERNEFDLEVLPGARSPSDAVFASSRILRGKLHHARDGRIDPAGGDPRVVSIRELGSGRFRLRVALTDLTAPPGLTRGFRAGQLFSLHARSDGDRGHGITIRSSRHVLLRCITVHACAGHVVTAEDSAGLQFLDCRFEPAPGRLALNNADGFHIRGNRKGPYLERCFIDRTNDDCMNFYCRASSVLDAPDASTLVLPAGDGSAWRAGDLVALLNPNTGEVDGLHSIREVRPSRWRDIPALTLVLPEPLRSPIHTRESTGRGPIAAREYTPSGGEVYRRAMAIPAPFEHMVANLSQKNDGFLVRHCDMGCNRGSVFKCKASNGVLEHCRFRNPSMERGIIFQAELNWREGFFPHHVLVRSCRIGGRLPITAGAVLPRQGSLQSAKLPWIRDIWVQDCWDEYGLRPIEWPLAADRPAG